MTQAVEHKNDKTLWQGIKAGEKHSFNILFRRYYSELYYYGIKLIPDPDFIKECIQEVFIRVWETRQNVADVENGKAYLLVCLRRMLLVQNKKNKLRQSVEVDQIENSIFYFELNEFEKHNELSEEVHHALLSAVNSLTSRQRELVMLFFYHGMTYSEIAEITGISIQAVRNLMYRTLIHLRKTISEKPLPLSSIFYMLFSSFSSKKV